MNRIMMDLWVGIFVAIGIVATIFISLKVANLASSTSGDTYQVSADFDNIGGLKVRAPVKCSGVIVGRVTDVKLDTQKYIATVTMNIEKRYSFTKDTSASILTSGLLGEQYIGLEMGAETDFLKFGDKIVFTSSALVLESLVTKFMFDSSGKGTDTK